MLCSLDFHKPQGAIAAVDCCRPYLIWRITFSGERARTKSRIMEDVMVQTSLSNELAATCPKQGTPRLSVDDAIDDLRQAIRGMEISARFYDRLVVSIVYLFVALVVALSLYIGFYGLP